MSFNDSEYLDISIIVPMFNCEKTIIRLIESIEMQGVCNYEVILVDDGSNDNTFELVKSKYGDKKNFIILKQENRGAPAARNVGISLARGKYIYFCDADDVISDGALISMLKCIREKKADLIVANLIHICNDKEIVYRPFKKRAKIIGKSSFFMADPVPGTKLYCKKIIDDNNLSFDNVKIGQDLNFYIKYLMNSKKPIYLDKEVYEYYEYQNSISRTFKVEKILDIKKSIEYINEHNVKYKNNKYYKQLEYVKLSNYIWQLKKKKHFSEADYELICTELLNDIRFFRCLDIRFVIAYIMPILEYISIKWLKRPIRFI